MRSQNFRIRIKRRAQIKCPKDFLQHRGFANEFISPSLRLYCKWNDIYFSTCTFRFNYISLSVLVFRICIINIDISFSSMSRSKIILFIEMKSAARRVICVWKQRKALARRWKPIRLPTLITDSEMRSRYGEQSALVFCRPLSHPRWLILRDAQERSRSEPAESTRLRGISQSSFLVSREFPGPIRAFVRSVALRIVIA